MEQQNPSSSKTKRYTLRTFVQETFLTGNFFIQNDLITYASACAFSFLFSLLPVVIMCAVILIRVLKASPSVLNNLYQFDTELSQILDVSHLVNSVLDFQGGIIFNIVVGVFIFWLHLSQGAGGAAPSVTADYSGRGGVAGGGDCLDYLCTDLWKNPVGNKLFAGADSSSDYCPEQPTGTISACHLNVWLCHHLLQGGHQNKAPMEALHSGSGSLYRDLLCFQLFLHHASKHHHLQYDLWCHE